jgi:hypothetical protein
MFSVRHSNCLILPSSLTALFIAPWHVFLTALSTEMTIVTSLWQRVWLMHAHFSNLNCFLINTFLIFCNDNCVAGSFYLHESVVFAELVNTQRNVSRIHAQFLIAELRSALETDLWKQSWSMCICLSQDRTCGEQSSSHCLVYFRLTSQLIKSEPNLASWILIFTFQKFWC